MSLTETLDISAIDALLDRFKTRQKEQEDLAATTTEFEVDQPNALRPEALQSMGVRLRMVADRMAGDLSAVLRSQFQCSVSNFRLLRLGSAINAFPERCCIIELSVTELSLPAFLSLDMSTASSIIDRMVGGGGDGAEFDRDLTAIEQRVVSDVVNPIIDAYQSVMSGVASLTMGWNRFIGTRDEMLSFPPTELFLAAKFHADVEGGLEWDFEFFLPVADLTKAIERSATIPVQPVEVTQDRRQGLKRALCDVRVESTVEIGTAEVSLRDVSTLAPGDIIVLDSKPGQMLEFRVGGKPKYTGSLGRCGPTMGFKIATQIDNKSNDASSRGNA